ncbi:acireductone synthase [Parvibaculum sp. MBR-TMA-1.3b-4.2]|jgi:enolase-phosphatase E1
MTDKAVKAVVTDIEGTTTPIEFVHEVLFPYARERMAAFCNANAAVPEVAKALADARELAGDPALDLDGTVALLLQWMAEDRKAGPLKSLQGLIWREGYEGGVLKGQVYEDVPGELRRWRERGLSLFVYSSGSVAAQKLIFGYSDKGDLTSLFDGYFDTAIGAKVEAASYGAIAGETGFAPGDILFLSDHGGEIAAAQGAGLQAVRLDRALPRDAWTQEDTAPVAGSFTAVEAHLSPGR